MLRCCSETYPQPTASSGAHSQHLPSHLQMHRTIVSEEIRPDIALVPVAADWSNVVDSDSTDFTPIDAVPVGDDFDVVTSASDVDTPRSDPRSRSLVAMTASRRVRPSPRSCTVPLLKSADRRPSQRHPLNFTVAAIRHAFIAAAAVSVQKAAELSLQQAQRALAEAEAGRRAAAESAKVARMRQQNSALAVARENVQVAQRQQKALRPRHGADPVRLHAHKRHHATQHHHYQHHTECRHTVHMTPRTAHAKRLS